MSTDNTVGEEMWQWARDLFPICRSITGEGVRQTLRYLNDRLGHTMIIHEVPSGTQAFDWTVPREWNIRQAYIENEQGQKIVDFRNCNLHVVGYSVPVDAWMTLRELEEHLFSLEDQPEAIPYVTSYYQERWGFCLSHNERRKLRDGLYHVVIDSELKDGHLTYGECLIPGATDKEVFLSTYVCHPSMANNELSGPVVLTAVARWLMSQRRRYTYRLVFIPETIGSIVYLSQHLNELKRKVVVGFNLSCIGDERGYSFVSSPYGNTLADKIAETALQHMGVEYTVYSYLDRGSDERQYCSPGIDLPLVTLCRSKFGTYPEYHTSLDDLNLVTPAGLQGGYNYVKQCLELAEANAVYRITCCGEPQLGKRGLYPTISTKSSGASVSTMMNLITYADGTNDLIDISRIVRRPVWELNELALRLKDVGLLKEVEKGSLTRASTLQ